MPAVNVGFPGSCAGLHQLPELNPFSLCNLVDAVASDDWTQQDAALGGQLTSSKSLFHLRTAGFPKVTLVGLEYGTNDFQYNRPIGNDDDCCKETFKGALNYSVQKLSATFPQLRLFLITPSWLRTPSGEDSDRHPNEGGVYLRQYVDAMIRIAELNHIPCLDLWRTLGMNRHNQTTFTGDGVHPTDFGAVRRGQVIASFIRSIS